MNKKQRRENGNTVEYIKDYTCAGNPRELSPFRLAAFSALLTWWGL